MEDRTIVYLIMAFIIFCILLAFYLRLGVIA